ncbi:hypothetical protein F4774DRAFT_379846 [Daldinia eschscholtzii]|nr:hypothetical protein F4774DRAFT_379846 [Daldinia eschscholtzii]
MSEQDRNTVKRNSSSRRGVPHRRPRKRLSCEPCRNAKLRCDRQQPCTTCRRRECEAACTFRTTHETVVCTTVSEVVPLVQSSPACSSPRTTPTASTTATASAAIETPAATTTYHQQISLSPTLQETVTESQSSHLSHGKNATIIGSWDSVLERPTSDQDHCAPGRANDLLASFTFGPNVPMSELLGMLPSRPILEFFISRYFTYQAPLFHVLHGPTFQEQYTKFTSDPARVSLSWLALLFIICSSAVQTLETGDSVLNDYQSSRSDIRTSDPLLLSRHLRSCALTCLSEARFMVRYDLNTLETLLIMIYGMCHSEGVDRSWVFLGAALNMAIALRCNADSPNQNCIEKQRGWRCWAGIRILHTYQGILFRDVDLSFLLTFRSPVPEDVNDSDIRRDTILRPSSYPTSMSLMKFKIRLFELSTQICSRLSNASTFDEASMMHYHDLIVSEQQQWTSLFLPYGSPSLFDIAGYAHWCILETYAHQLYLLIHRPFYHSQSTQFLPSSRKRYVESSIALLDIHQKMCELPTLRSYRWLVNGMTSFNALQGAVALAACLIDRPGQTDPIASHRATLDAAVKRIQSLQESSVVCARAYSALQNIQTQISILVDGDGDAPSQEWDATADWLDLNSIDWAYWDNIVADIPQGTQ